MRDESRENDTTYDEKTDTHMGVGDMFANEVTTGADR
jgi:hypothetical protein